MGLGPLASQVSLQSPPGLGRIGFCVGTQFSDWVVALVVVVLLGLVMVVVVVVEGGWVS